MKIDHEAIVRAIRDEKVIAIVRGFPAEICVKLAESYFAAGIRLIEVTFDQSRGDHAPTLDGISAIKAALGDRMHVGAGTVLTAAQLEAAVKAGAEFMVTPNTNAELIGACRARGLVALPGAFSPTEAVVAHEAGADFVKIFPAGELGASYIKAIRAPLKHIPMLAVGGVGPDNAADFIAAGCVGVGVGGNLTNKEWIAAGAWEKIEEVARRLVAAVK